MLDTHICHAAEEIEIMSSICLQSPLDVLKNLTHAKVARSNSLVMRLLARFYPDKIHATRDLEKHKSKYEIITRLVMNNNLQKIDDCHMAARYKITMQGKCKILCNQFGIRFLSLCILAEAYALHKIQAENRCPLSYSLFETYRIFEGIYSQKTIRNSANILATTRLAYSKSSNMIVIRENTMKNLLQHDAVLDEIHEWIVGVPNYLSKMALEDPQAYKEIINNR